MSLDLKSQEMPSSVLEEERRTDCLQPKGNSYDRLVFVELVIQVFWRGPSLNIFHLVSK